MTVGVENEAGNPGPAPMIVHSIMAAADPSEWERRRGLPKRMGELSEAAFLYKASALGFGVAKPWGDSERYDFIVWGQAGRMWRVQIKSTSQKHRRGYSIKPTCNRSLLGKLEYTGEDIDILVVHIQPIDVWYVLPVAAFSPARSLNFFPDIASRSARWEQYRDAWQWLENNPGHTERK